MYVMRNDRTSNSLAFDFLLSLGSVLAPKKYLEKNKPSPLYLVWKYIVVNSTAVCNTIKMMLQHTAAAWFNNNKYMKT